MKTLLLFLQLLLPFVLSQYDFAAPASEVHPPSASPYAPNGVEANKDDPSEVLTSDRPLPEGSGTTDKVEGSGVAFSEDEGSGETVEVKEQHDDFTKMMNTMDNIAEKSGVACPADVLFVVDSTSSVKELFDLYKTYVTKVVQGLTVSPTQDHVGVILYSGLRIQREKIHLGQINDSGRLMTAIKGLPFLSGITATGAALNFAKTALKNRRKEVRAAVVVITDGFSYDLVEDAARQLRSLSNVEVYSVTLGGPSVESELLTIAGDVSRVLKGENSYGELVNLLKSCPADRKSKKKPATNNRKPKVETATVRYIETATDSEGRHLIPNPVVTDTEVRHFDDSKNAVHREPVVSQMISVNENRRADMPAPSCQNDFLLVFDSSGSMKQNFIKQLDLAGQLVDKFSVGPKEAQFAAINYAGKKKVRTLFNFTQFSTKEQIKKKINQTMFISGTTATNEALLRAVNMFSSSDARRDGAKPVLVVFTDGFSGDSPLKGATILHKMGVTVFVIGVNDDPKMLNMEEIKMIASDATHVYTLSTFNKFMADMEKLAKTCLMKRTT